MDIEQSAQLMLDELRQTTAYSGQLQHKLNDVSQQVSTWRTEIEQTIQTAISEVAELENGLLAQKNAVFRATRDVLEDVLPPLKEGLASGHEQLHNLQTQTLAMMQELIAATEVFQNQIAEQQHAVEQGIQELTTSTQTLQQQIDSQFEQARQAVQALTEAINEGHQEWQDYLQQGADTLREAQQTCQEHLMENFFNPVQQGLEQYQTLIQQIDQEALTQPLTTLKQEAVQMINQQVSDVFKQGFAELDRLMQELMDQITGADQKSQAERQALQEVYQLLEQLFQPIKEQVESIRDIGRAVGIRI